MRQIKNSSKSIKQKFNKGMTLVEVLMALVILMLTIIPIIAAFSKYYGVSSKQLDQEIALKITEAAINKLLSAKFSSLNGAADINFPLNLQTPAGTFSGQFHFEDHNGKSNKIKLGANSYQLFASTSQVFEAQKLVPFVANPNSLQFRYIDDTSGTPVHSTYYCTDVMIAIQMDITYGKKENKLSMVTFRADMTQ